MITVLIADDHALLRQGIRNVLELDPGLRVVGEASEGEEAVQKAVALQPAIVLLDISMPHTDGIEVTRQLVANTPSAKVIVLTMHDDEDYVAEVIKAGAMGYLLKEVEPSMLINAIRAVYDGEAVIYPTLAKKLFGKLGNLVVQPSGICKEEKYGLTAREIEVLEQICKGMSNQTIASSLFLSEKTVKSHLTNIFRKLNVNDRTQAVLFALKNKLVHVD